jgi:heme oxygenase
MSTTVRQMALGLHCRDAILSARGESVPIVQTLRAQTAARHLSLHELPFFVALESSELPLLSYVGQLRAMAIVHAAIERSLGEVRAPAVTAVWREHMKRLPELMDDLQSFEGQPRSDVPEATTAALEWAHAIRQASVEDPVCLLGHFYVLEGATLGAMALRSQVARTFNLAGARGLRYLSHNDGQERRRFNELTDRMDAVPLDEAAQRRVVSAANDCFEYLLRIFRALYPMDPETLVPQATSLNPEAGSHRVPTDPREIDAAMRAGAKSLGRIPYLEARYGERGRRFTSSDSAWLVTLSELDEPRAISQVFWLGRVLAARGMPRLILEVHLELLFEELADAVPEKRHQYEQLLRAARALRDARCRLIDEERFDARSIEFEARVGAVSLRGIGKLLVAAVTDAADGVPSALESLEGWLTDPTRFPPQWIAAVRSTLDDVRREVNGGAR